MICNFNDGFEGFYLGIFFSCFDVLRTWKGSLFLAVMILNLKLAGWRKLASHGEVTTFLKFLESAALEVLIVCVCVYIYTREAEFAD